MLMSVPALMYGSYLATKIFDESSILVTLGAVFLGWIAGQMVTRRWIPWNRTNVQLGDSVFGFPLNRIHAIELILINQNQRGREGGGSENGRRRKQRNKLVRKPLKSREAAKWAISCPNDFNSLRGAWRNKIVSQTKFSSSQAK